MSVIELKDVHVTFHEGGKTVEAVKGVNLLALDGEIYGIVGYSGAGKSTLVRTINLLERPTQGRVFIDGEDITDARGARLRELRRKIGFVFQGFNLVGNLTVGQNIQFALKAGGWKRGEWRERTLELLRLVGLEDRIDSYPSGLSGGQKQRVAIARALANDPKILLCDEATSALDLETTQDILALLRRINRELHITIVFITHQLEVAKEIFDHVAVMENGRIVEQGETFDVFSAPKHPTTKSLVGRFLGITLPPRLVRSLPAGELVELTYRGDDALEPLISDVARNRGVSVNVLHGNVEYFGARPIGVLIVLVSGEDAAVAAALDDIRGKVLKFEVLDRDELAAGDEAHDGEEGNGAEGAGDKTIPPTDTDKDNDKDTDKEATR
ncbi:ABC transporter ATP-binding protein [Pseudoscardovia radai]|uniref:ABC transporter ATP-binding protein n=1 Tax=Pseudoscardovia radai TaxID=987066 RepID=A0A261EXT0_9BIFI|nr:ATP-binding cassette domain-containing protein [Pseudoscardovia radai]OZG51664.1 ABC transporter ATP-binding protein [Pseudoscardovia radai]